MKSRMWTSVQRSLAVGVALALMACTALGQEFGKTTHTVGNVTIWSKLEISGVDEPGDPISGTNVHVTASAGGGSSSTDPYDDAKFFHAKLWIDGTLIYERTYEVEEGLGGGGFESLGGGGVGGEYAQLYQPPPVRFASNHVPHGDPVEIKLQADFKIFKNGLWIASGSVTTQIVPKAYNQLASWMTTVDQNNDPLNNFFLSEVDAYMDEMRSKFQAANYGIDPDKLDFSDNDGKAEIEIATATSVNTHGTGELITMSGAVTSDSERLTWQEIGDTTYDSPSEVWTRPHSWVILYSCSTFIAASTIREKFRLNEPSITAHAYLGFPQVMTWDCIEVETQATVGCDKYIKELFLNLQAGYCLQVALDRTWSKYWPVVNSSSQETEVANLQRSGDAMSTWTSVYLTEAERIERGVLEGVFTQWYIVIE